MAKFLNPKLLISDYYDELIKEIDVHTEQRLERFSDNDILDDHWNISDHQDNPFNDISEWGDSEEKLIDRFKHTESFENVPMREPEMDLTSIKVKDYVEKTRTEMLEVLYKTRQENLDFYDQNKERFSTYRHTMDDPEELKRELFSNKFCFLLSNMKDNKLKRGFFGLTLVIIDFYLSQNDLTVIRNNQFEKFRYISIEIDKKSTPESIWANLVRNFMLRLFHLSNDDLFLLELSRQQILDETRKVNVRFSNDGEFDGELSRPLSQIKFTHLTHFDASFAHADLEFLPPSLEFLGLYETELADASLPLLPNLGYLQLRECNFNDLRDDWLNSFPSLRVLHIDRSVGFSILNTKNLSFLSHFLMENQAEIPLDLLDQSSESLQFLQGPFSSRYLARYRNPNLATLDLREFYSKKFDCASLSGLPNLKRLLLGEFHIINLNHPSLKVLDFFHLSFGKELPVLESFINLKHLSLSGDKLKLRGDDLSHFSSLISLRVEFVELDPEFFARMPNLERLELLLSRGSRFGSNRKSFSPLTKLKELSIRGICDFFSLESGIFSALTSLETLKLELKFFLSNANVSLPFGLFDGLERLKFLFVSFFEGSFASTPSVDLNIFRSVSNLQLLDFSIPADVSRSRRDFVKFLLERTQIKTLWHRGTTDYLPKYQSNRFFDLDKMRNKK